VKLAELYEQIKDCAKCKELVENRTNMVFGTGREDADIVFVGEAPGYYEDQQGEPFVGAAGRLLTRLLADIGLKREDVYICNVLKCRPPNNRDPLPEEIENCKPYLLKQLEIIKPKIICTLGNFATQVILDKKIPISRVRGKPIKKGESIVFPIYHPAAALHRNGILDPLMEDFQTLKKVLNGEIAEFIEDLDKADTIGAGDGGGEQLDLF